MPILYQTFPTPPKNIPLFLTRTALPLGSFMGTVPRISWGQSPEFYGDSPQNFSQHFVTRFRHETGLTPHEMRRSA